MNARYTGHGTYDHAFGDNGYRMHINPDNSAVWLEGHPRYEAGFMLGAVISAAIEACCARRGLIFSPMIHGNFFFTPTGERTEEQMTFFRLRKLRAIIRLEHEFCGEEEW